MPAARAQLHSGNRPARRGAASAHPGAGRRSYRRALSHAGAYPNTHADAYPDGNADTYARTDGYTRAHAHAGTYPDGNAGAHSDTDSHAAAHSHADTHADGDAGTHADAADSLPGS